MTIIYCFFAERCTILTELDVNCEAACAAAAAAACAAAACAAATAAGVDDEGIENCADEVMMAEADVDDKTPPAAAPGGGATADAMTEEDAD